MEMVQTAAEAAERYKAFKLEGRLTQGSFHVERDGRQLACALGVTGDDVNSPSACPAAVMPRWLAYLVPSFFDGQKAEDAFEWGERFYTALARIDGKVPFSVVHDWQANVVAPLGIEWRELKKVSTAETLAVQALHIKALAGEKASRAEWREALFPYLKQTYLANANANANAYANAYADADADANAYANANANAYANADADANAYANADANADADAKLAKRQEAYKRLADGMVDCLNRVAVS